MVRPQRYTYVRQYTQNVRLTRSFYPLLDGAGCLRMLSILQRKQGQMTINKHQTHNFLGTQGFRYSRCVTIPGLPGDYSYFARVPKVTGNFLSLFELFEACFVLRERKTATVSIEFSKEVKYSMQKEQTSPK